MSDRSDLIIGSATPRDIAGIGAFRNRDALLAALQAEFAVAIPTTTGFVQASAVTLSRLAPARYLATAPRDSNLVARLTKTLAGLAAITDQSDQWECFTLSGPPVRECLARLVPVDLTPAQFPIGHLALTRAGHLDIRLWRVGAETYELAVARSYVEDLRYWLQKEGRVLF